MSHTWRGRTALVTGGTGLLGPWLIRRLTGEGAQVICLIRDNVPRSNFYRMHLDMSATVVRGEVEDYSLLERILNEYEVDTVFHVAAQAIVGAANRSPLSTFEANIKGTWNLLEAARTSRLVRAVVVASSDKAYGDQKELPYTESARLEGSNPYDVSKSCADLIAQAYFRTFQLPVAITRCGNLFGGGDLNFSRLVPGTIRSALAEIRPVIRSNGKYVRDYFYIEDAVNAYLTLAEQLIERPELRGEAFNFSNDSPCTVLEMTERILQTMGSDLAPEIRNEAHHEIENQYLSSAKARAKLGWKPEFSLDEALDRTITWYRGYFEADGQG